jgi:hypothetical protein
VVLAALNGLITEYVLRPKLSNMHLNNFRLESLPLPLGGDDDILGEISKLSAALQKKARKEFEEEDSYRRIEALLCMLYGVTNEEIREYVDSFGSTQKSFVDDVIDYVKVYGEQFFVIEPIVTKELPHVSPVLLLHVTVVIFFVSSGSLTFRSTSI